MFTHSDLAELRRHLLPHHRAVLDQCQYGASVDEQPIKKATEINSNVDIASSSVDLNRKCQKNHDHNQLQGSSKNGQSKTAQAAVYTHELCDQILNLAAADGPAPTPSVRVGVCTSEPAV